MINGNIFPFLLSVDGILGKDALVVLVNLIQLIATKLEEPLSQVHGFINGHIAIVVARSYPYMIHGACLPSALQERERDWDPGPVLGLVK